jgi:carboxypeptidase Q
MKQVARTLALVLLVALASGALQERVARETVYLDVVERIKEEGLERSHLPDLFHHLLDRIGPRLSGSPGYKRAAEWSMAQMAAYGLQDVRLESWGPFGRGWEEVSYSGNMVEPFARPLTGRAGPWTGSTQGAQRGPAIYLDVEEEADLAGYRGQLRGAWILMDRADDFRAKSAGPTLRSTADQLLTPAAAAPPGPGRPQFSPEELQQRQAEMQARHALAARVEEMLAEEEVAGFLYRSSMSLGAIRTRGSGSRQAGAPHGPPRITLINEDYSLLYRLSANGEPTVVEFDVQNRFFEDDLNGYNVIGEYRGTDLAHQYVILGGHLDSYHVGTGATDNAAGAIVMLEAVRILNELGLRPRRTIKVAFWGGEEQGLIGSREYLNAHADKHDDISAYLNIDNGTGRLRGIWNQGNEQVTPIFEQILFPFRDLGVVAVRHGNTGSTDHVAFDRVGLPGFNFIQDPMAYGSTYHSNLDTYEAISLDDLQQAAVVVASTAYHLAMRDDMLPRKPAEAQGPPRR